MTLGRFRDDAARARFVDIYDEGMARLPTPSRTVDVPTSYGTVRAYRFGDSDDTPLLLLPGRQSSTPLWASNIGPLMDGRTVWAIDLLGEPGLSVQSAPIADSTDQSSWLSQTITGLGLAQVHLLGVSIGGWSAINLAIREPELVASATVVDPPQTFSRISLKMVLVSMGSVIPFMPPALRSWLLGWISGGVRSAADLPEGRLIASSMRDYSSTLPVPTRPSDDELRSIDCPVLALFAGRSIVHDAEKAAAQARSVLRHGTVEVWATASHALNGEYPQELADRVHSFLGDPIRESE